MYSVDGVKLLKEDVETYRRVKNDPYAKQQWWKEIKRQYKLDEDTRYKIRFVAVILESD